MSLGKRLRTFRYRKGVTQEQMAEAFNLSAQAVSRWENDTASPDISLIPGICIYFGITADELFGMERIRSYETISKLHTDVNRLVTGKNPEEAVRLIRENLKVYPEDNDLLMTLSETLAHTGKKEDSEEAVLLFLRCLESREISFKAKSTVCANLVYLYIRLGKLEEAKKIVKSLPHIWECREIMMTEIGGEYIPALREFFGKALALLYHKAINAENRIAGETPGYLQLGFDFDTGLSEEKLIDGILDFLKKNPI